jgi:hypothetical protein
MKSDSVVHPSELIELTPDENHEKAKGSRQLLKPVREADWWVCEVSVFSYQLLRCSL